MRFAFLKIPFDAGNPTGARGPAKAPELICKEAMVEGELVKVGDFEETNKNIVKAVYGRKVLAIGGDHSITYALVKATNPEALLYFDAHLDCEDDFLPPSHEDVIKAIVNEGLVKPENIFIVGARKFYPKELKFVKERGINVIGDINSKIELLISRFKSIYCSIDIDVFDPEEAPGTYYKEKQGVKSEDFFRVLESINSNCIIGVDITEVSPQLDSKNKTVKLAAKIIKRFL